MKKLALALASAALLMVPAAASAASTVVPGQQDRYDADQNGFPDAGQVVNGRYSDVYVDGATVCKLVVTYRGDFGNNAYLDSGEISNHYECKGPDGNATFNYQIVSQGDPRYRGNPDWAIWGTWEYHVLTQGGQGNDPFGGNGNLVGPYSG
jgi:opacity protein-like surface antigen